MLLLFLLHLTEAAPRTDMAADMAVEEECWFDPPAICQPNSNDLVLYIDQISLPTLGEQMAWCQAECAGVAASDLLHTCNFFTVHLWRGGPKCYLMEACTRDPEAECLAAGTCGGGVACSAPTSSPAPPHPTSSAPPSSAPPSAPASTTEESTDGCTGVSCTSDG